MKLSLNSMCTRNSSMIGDKNFNETYSNHTYARGREMYEAILFTYTDVEVPLYVFYAHSLFDAFAEKKVIFSIYFWQIHNSFHYKYSQIFTVKCNLCAIVYL